MTKICIHQAADKIGGNCVEIAAEDGRRLLIDAGLPLEPGNLGRPALPPASLDREGRVEGVILSHSHADHSGLLHELPADWPIICGEDTAAMLSFRLSKKSARPQRTWVRENKPAVFMAGSFQVTAFNVDHSAFDAYALLIEIDGRRIFYSGDFRGHGRKGALTERFLKNPPAGIDVLIMEGTSLPSEGRESQAPLTETDLEKQFEEVFRRTRGRVFVSWPAGNIDRMVTLFKACNRSRRTLAIDMYTALVWEEMGRFAKLPALTREINIRVVPTRRVGDWLEKLGKGNPAKRFMAAKVAIPARALEERPGQWVVMARNSLARSGYAGKVHPTADDAWVWSQWAGYLKDEAQTGDIKKFLAPCGEPSLIHSSGHAPPELLARLAKAIKPKILLPIHGEAWPRHQADFENIRIVENGQWLEI
jgi:ribonuclease J